jgi:beta-1,4-N-acetylglucosaminyltransferase
MKTKTKLLLVASSGGHRNQLYFLRDFWGRYEHSWVTFNTTQGRDMREQGEEVIWAYHPTNRNIINLLRNCILAYKVLKTGKYTHVISTGAGVGVPFIWMGKLLGIKTCFIDSFTRIEGLSLSAKLVYPFVDYLLTQWPKVAEKYPKVIYKGKVL